MSKRKAKIAILAAVILFAVILIYFDAKLINRVQEASEDEENQSRMTSTADTDIASGNTDGTNADDGIENLDSTIKEATDGNTETGDIKKSEQIRIAGNTPEYDLELVLTENKDGKTFIKLKYYIDGESKSNELDEGELPELAEMFENRQVESENTGAFSIAQAMLNPVHSQLYILIHGAPLGSYYQSSLYMIELYDMSVKKLFSYPGIYGKIAFNNGCNMLAYSFEDPKQLSNFQEDSLVEVYDCVKCEYLINGSRDKSGKVIGKNSSSDYFYDYIFDGWHAANILRLKQTLRRKNQADSQQTEAVVLYDIERNILLNIDGSEQVIPASGDGEKSVPSGGEAKDESSNDADMTEAVAEDMGEETAEDVAEDVKNAEKTLIDFYSYLANQGDYENAMKLLHDNFSLKLQMLEQFGVSEIIKSDIDMESASVYGQLLRGAKFDTIVDADLKDEICTITYYHTLGSDTGSQIKQLLSAQLRKSEDGWKIILIEDGIK